HLYLRKQGKYRYQLERIYVVKAVASRAGRSLVRDPEPRRHLTQALLEERRHVGEGEAELVEDLHAEQPVQPDPRGEEDVRGLRGQPPAGRGGVGPQLLAQRRVQLVEVGNGEGV